MEKKNVIEALKDAYAGLTPTLQRLASYIINNHKEAAFLNSMTLTRRAGVSNGTVTRLSCALRMSGFVELRQALQDYAKTMMSLPRSDRLREDGFILKEVAALEKNAIDEMVESVSEADFLLAADILHEAKTVDVVGAHYNYPPAAYAGYYLKSLKPLVRIVDRADIFAFSPAPDPGSAVLAVGTARYPRETWKILKLYKDENAKIVLISDSNVSPYNSLADVVLTSPMKYMSFMDPYSGVMTLIHSLLNALFLRSEDVYKPAIEKYAEFMKTVDMNLDDRDPIVDIRR
ncbi:MAG: MurR/RpiR family transcriptional regulator [Deltaproteobacteria bacterium]|nr:MurR/RpiR family transcriptional regulator [Deltaproteobacteria bacterium]